MNQKLKATLSLCMIVKNEEEYLPDCLESVRNVVDQIVVVDTGSTDRTVEIARSFGAEVHSFEWRNDFAAARNESLKHATGDWILWMDADERLIPSSLPALKKILRPEKKPVIYRVEIRSPVQGGHHVRISSAHRIFTHRRGISFTGAIHEQVSYRAAQVGAVERDSGVVLEHLGYDLDEVAQQQKNERNRQILEAAVQKEPQNAYLRYTLGQHFAVTGELEKAREEFLIAYQLGQLDKALKASLLNTLGEVYFKLGEPENAYRVCRQSVQMEPLQVGAYYLLYRLAEERGELAEAAEWLEKIIANNRVISRQGKKIAADVVIEDTKLQYARGMLFKRLKRFTEARECFQEIAHQVPQNEAVLGQLAEISLAENNLSEAEDYLFRLFNLNPSNNQYVDVLGKVLIMQQKFNEAIGFYEVLLKVHPQNQNYRKRLAGLYGKIGNLEKARQLLMAT